MSLLKQRGRELERFDGLSLIYWYVQSEQVWVKSRRVASLCFFLFLNMTKDLPNQYDYPDRFGTHNQ